MDFVIEPAERPALPVAGTDKLFPLRRVYCVGRNYAEHAREMGHDPNREPPFFFQKNPDSLFVGSEFPYPAASKDVHHEIELLVALKSGGTDIPAGEALTHVFGYAVALDMTRRDLQAEAKKLGRPWEVAKAFDRSAPCSPIVPAARVGHPAAGAIWLDVNGTRRQSGDLKDMIWTVPELIACLSRLFELSAGDVVLTGTPANSRPMEPGDVVEVEIDGLGRLTNRVVDWDVDLTGAGEQLEVSPNTLHVALAIPEDEAERRVEEAAR